MALKFAPKLRRQPRQGSKWKPLSPLPLRPSRSTTCAKPWIKGWKSAGLFSSRRLAGRVGTFSVAREPRLRAITRTTLKKRRGAGVDDRGGRENSQVAGGG